MNEDPLVVPTAIRPVSINFKQEIWAPVSGIILLSKRLLTFISTTPFSVDIMNVFSLAIEAKQLYSEEVSYDSTERVGSLLRGVSVS